MINWKKFDKDNYPKESLNNRFILCYVWMCNGKNIEGGVPDVVRWDVENKCWFANDFTEKFGGFDENVFKVTHFCEQINSPSNDLNQENV